MILLFIVVDVVCCLLFVVCCLLFVVCCLLFVVCCLLFVVCCLLFVCFNRFANIILNVRVLRDPIRMLHFVTVYSSFQK